ncbi:hypothetical protein [Melittangium boletus]|uniref:Uncharacterized protein n=1 Tax=Melittangium boletus DSM 14713 TaxID=1294270 RepID=A0A250IGR5_9BACT|nr:hypothetical protein [Melittangium boletus]ATB30413.1 hypothetical protein MEBOL_003874 [Melittangium boletus DSM 14713]
MTINRLTPRPPPPPAPKVAPREVRPTWRNGGSMPSARPCMARATTRPIRPRGFGTTAPSTPMPPGARPVQEPQPTGVPGVSADPDNSPDQAKAARQLANQTGANVICVHNGTNGFVPDVAQAAQSGQPVHVAAHSQGAIITSDALQQTKDNLRVQDMSTAQVEQTLGMGLPPNAAQAIASGQRVVVAPNPGPIYGDPFQNHGFSGYVPQAGLPS